MVKSGIETQVTPTVNHYDNIYIYPTWSTMHVLSCQPRVTVTSCLVFTIIRDSESIYHSCINPFHRIWLIHKWSFHSHGLKWSVQVNVLLNNCEQNTTSLSLLSDRTVTFVVLAWCIFKIPDSWLFIAQVVSKKNRFQYIDSNPICVKLAETSKVDIDPLILFYSHCLIRTNVSICSIHASEAAKREKPWWYQFLKQWMFPNKWSLR